MRYIYVDLGAYSGDTIDMFMDLSKAKGSTQFFDKPPILPVDPSKFDLYAFEPNPKFKDKLSNDSRIKFSSKVAYTYDGEIEFAIDPTDNPMGSTTESSKKHIWEIGSKAFLPCFDFSGWIKRFKDDYVIVKMDIEGAEFPILEKMIKDGTHKIMDQLWVETHPNKVSDYTTTDSNKLIQRLRQDIKVELWH